jgi:serine/threonine protein kinase
MNQLGSLRKVNLLFNSLPFKFSSFILVLENGTLTNASDIWSFAILLWELFTRRIPFAEFTPMQCGLKVFANSFFSCE